MLYRGLGDHTFYNMYIYIYYILAICASYIFCHIHIVNLPTFHTIHFTLHHACVLNHILSLPFIVAEILDGRVCKAFSEK